MKFYVKIDEGVEGPFEPHLLRYLNGFTEETLVSPEDLTVAEWNRALLVPEIKPHLGGAPAAAPFAAPSESIASSLPSSPSVPTAFVSPSGQAINPAPPLSRPSDLPPTTSIAQVPQSVQPVAADQELLDVMEQFSGQLPAQEPTAAANVTIPRFEPPVFETAAPDVSTMVPPLQEKFVPKKSKKNKRLLGGLAALLVVASAAGFMAFKMGMLEQWKGLIQSFLNKGAPPASIVQVPPPVSQPPAPPADLKPLVPIQPIQVRKVEKIEKKPAKKTAQKTPPAPKVQAKKEKPVPPPPPPPKEQPLKTQKYMLPGVPSPKVQETPKQEAKPVQDEVPTSLDAEYQRELEQAKEREEAASKKEKKSKEKKKKPANDDDYFEFQWISADPGEKK